MTPPNRKPESKFTSEKRRQIFDWLKEGRLREIRALVGPIIRLDTRDMSPWDKPALGAFVERLDEQESLVDEWLDMALDESPSVREFAAWLAATIPRYPESFMRAVRERRETIALPLCPERYLTAQPRAAFFDHLRNGRLKEIRAFVRPLPQLKLRDLNPPDKAAVEEFRAILKTPPTPNPINDLCEMLLDPLPPFHTVARWVIDQIPEFPMGPVVAIAHAQWISRLEMMAEGLGKTSLPQKWYCDASILEKNLKRLAAVVSSHVTPSLLHEFSDGFERAFGPNDCNIGVWKWWRIGEGTVFELHHNLLYEWATGKGKPDRRLALFEETCRQYPEFANSDFLTVLLFYTLYSQMNCRTTHEELKEMADKVDERIESRSHPLLEASMLRVQAAVRESLSIQDVFTRTEGGASLAALQTLRDLHELGLLGDLFDETKME